jgi:hypothetical protein
MLGNVLKCFLSLVPPCFCLAHNSVLKMEGARWVKFCRISEPLFRRFQPELVKQLFGSLLRATHVGLLARGLLSEIEPGSRVLGLCTESCEGLRTLGSAPSYTIKYDIQFCWTLICLQSAIGVFCSALPWIFSQTPGLEEPQTSFSVSFLIF